MRSGLRLSACSDGPCAVRKLHSCLCCQHLTTAYCPHPHDGDICCKPNNSPLIDPTAWCCTHLAVIPRGLLTDRPRCMYPKHPHVVTLTWLHSTITAGHTATWTGCLDAKLSSCLGEMHQLYVIGPCPTSMPTRTSCCLALPASLLIWFVCAIQTCHCVTLGTSEMDALLSCRCKVGSSGRSISRSSSKDVNNMSTVRSAAAADGGHAS